MSSSHTSSNIAFAGLAVVVIAGTSVGIAAGIAPLNQARLSLTEAVASDGGVPASRIAVLLDPHYTPARLTLAAADLAGHDEAGALFQLDHADASPVSLNLRTRALLEQGNDRAGVAAAELAYRLKPTDPATIKLLGAAYLLSGQTATLDVLRNQTTDGEARQTLQELGGSVLSQSQALYVLGLLKRSQVVLKTDPTPSSSAEVLQAKLALNLQAKPGAYAAALASLTSAAERDPANLEAHQLIVTVARLNHDDELASKHQALAQALSAGKP